MIGFTLYHVQSIKMLNAHTCWIAFDAPLAADPGQFVMAWLPEKGEKPFSIAGMDPFCLLVVDVGPFSHALHGLQMGDPIWIKGPLGRGFTLSGENLLLVGGGYGAAPLLSLAAAARKASLNVAVVLGARSSDDLLLVDAFEAQGCTVVAMTEDGSAGQQGLVTHPLPDLFVRGQIDSLYACGPSGMLSALAAFCSEKHIDYQLSWEAHMRCGMGLCGSCEVPRNLDPQLPVGWLACFDGPVFSKTWKPKS